MPLFGFSDRYDYQSSGQRSATVLSTTTSFPAMPKASSTDQGLGTDSTRWTAAAEAILIEHLLSAAQKGLKSDNNFKATVYKACSDALRAGGHVYTGKQVKS